MTDVSTDVKSAMLAGLTGTTTMTAFSYLVSEKQGKYFKEPEILNDLIDRLINTKADGKQKHITGITGFLLHYGTGITFSACNHFLWKRTRRVATAAGNGLGFGLLFGLIGIGIWKAVFTLHPNPPRIHLNDFLGHLLVAHVIFGETVSFTRTMLAGKPTATSPTQPVRVHARHSQRTDAKAGLESLMVDQAATEERES